MLVKMGSSSPSRDENSKNYLKPPPSNGLLQNPGPRCISYRSWSQVHFAFHNSRTPQVLPPRRHLHALEWHISAVAAPRKGTRGLKQKRDFWSLKLACLMKVYLKNGFEASFYFSDILGFEEHPKKCLMCCIRRDWYIYIYNYIYTYV